MLNVTVNGVKRIADLADASSISGTEKLLISTSGGSKKTTMTSLSDYIKTTIPLSSWIGTATPLMDGTAAIGSSTKYAKEDHVHPTDTSRQAALVSGTNIKTINGTSILGSGNLVVSELPTVSSSDNGKFLCVVNGVWAATTLSSANGVSF